MQYAAILLSRQPLRPSGCTPWVKRSVEAVRWLNDRGFGLVSSIGMMTWEIPTAVASDLRMPLLLIVPARCTADFVRECDRAINDFNLDPDTTGFAPVMPDDSTEEPNLSVARDRLVAEKAELLLPVSCREGGNMAALLHVARAGSCVVDSRFNAAETDTALRLKYEMSDLRLNDGLDEAGEKYLIHWTRGVSAPWPGERKISFYRDIIQSDCWPRSALDTLMRIVRMRRILASPRHMPGNVATVSLSSLAPRDVIPLMRWRARYGEMSFEPYGIGVERNLADQLDLREVQYFQAETQSSIPAEDRWRWQSKGEVTDWRAEREFRRKGDLDLERVKTDSVALFCRTSEEVEQLRAMHSGPIWSFLP